GLQYDGRYGVSVDAAHVSLQWMGVYLGDHRHRRHPCVPAQGAGRCCSATHTALRCYSHVWRTGGAEHAAQRLSRPGTYAVGACAICLGWGSATQPRHSASATSGLCHYPSVWPHGILWPVLTVRLASTVAVAVRR